MQGRMLKTALLIACLQSTACAHDASTKQQAQPCHATGECEVQGRLTLLPVTGQAWVAVVDSRNGCVKLALPDTFFADAKAWNGQEVSVSGSTFQQPGFDESQGMLSIWYTERDRRVGLGRCDGGPGIYVATMRMASGARHWP